MRVRPYGDGPAAVIPREEESGRHSTAGTLGWLYLILRASPKESNSLRKIQNSRRSSCGVGSGGVLVGLYLSVKNEKKKEKKEKEKKEKNKKKGGKKGVINLK